MTSQPLDQSATPYADALLRHRDALRAAFMIPGHSAGTWGSTDRLVDFMGAEAVTLDIPQLLPGVDLEADSPFARSRELAAEAWHAKQTWFLTNGASQGNRMALIAASAFGDTVIAQRSMHSSFFDGLVVSGLSPRFVNPSIDAVHGIAHGVTAGQIDAALGEVTDAAASVAAVAIVSPSYFGAVADIDAIAAVTRRHGVLLIVDASWGAHFGFHEEFPASPTEQGADIVVSSVHKLGGSLTQTALLHVTDNAPAELTPQLERAFRLTESTSPNSLLLVSLDIARAELASNRASLDASLAAAKRARELVASSSVLRLPDDDFLAHPDVVGLDPLHVAIDVRGLGIPGPQVKVRLGAEYGVFVEIASEHAIVALIGAGQDADPQLLISALESIARETATTDATAATGAAMDAVKDAATAAATAQSSRSVDPALRPPEPGEPVMTPRDAYFAESELVPARNAVGRISTDLLAAYPPGVPNIVPGERITAEAVAFLQSVTKRPSGFVRGAADPLVTHLRVVTPTA